MFSCWAIRHACVVTILCMSATAKGSEASEFRHKSRTSNHGNDVFLHQNTEHNGIIRFSEVGSYQPGLDKAGDPENSKDGEKRADWTSPIFSIDHGENETKEQKRPKLNFDHSSVEAISPNRPKLTADSTGSVHNDDFDSQIRDRAEVELTDETKSPQHRKTCTEYASAKYSVEEMSFECAPCKCFKSPNGYVKANCVDMSLASVPDHLPSDVREINMSGNAVRVFDTSWILNYSRLTVLDISHNNISTILTSVNQSKTIPSATLKAVFFNFNKIDAVQDNAFRSFIGLEILDLSMNRLKNITKDAFQGLHQLCLLDLSRNQLKYIHQNSFDVFSRLRALYLNNNKDLGYAPKRFKPRIFKNLKALKVFYINGCAAGSTFYPNGVFDQMPQLEEISIDGIDSPLFSQEMLNITEIKIGPDAFCYFKNLSQKLFKNAPNLTHLSIQYCNFQAVEPNTFLYNQKLTNYHLKHSATYKLEVALLDLKYLQHCPLRTIKFVHLYHSTVCRILSQEHSKYMKNFELQLLDLKDNRITLLGNDFLCGIPRSLRKLVLSRNRFELTGNLWNRIPFLGNLTEIDLDDQNEDKNYIDKIAYNSKTSSCSTKTDLPHTLAPSHQKIASEHPPKCPSAVENAGMNNWSTVNTPGDMKLRSTLDGYQENTSATLSSCQFEDSNLRGKIHLPPNLHIVKAKSYYGFGMLILLMHIAPNNLTTLVVPHSFLSKWGHGRLPANITHADFSYNQCNVLEPDFFPKNNRLVHFHIKGNYLGGRFSEDKNGKLFSLLNKLEYLDVSTNNIFGLPKHFLKGLVNLSTLDVSENKLRILDLDFSYTKSVKFIDFSKNSINFISPTTMDSLDKIASDHTLMVDFNQNSFQCTCAALPMIKWLSETRIVLKSQSTLKCINSNGVVESIGNIHSRYLSLQKKCMSKIPFTVLGLIVGSVVFILSVTFFTYHQRWKLRYLKNRFIATLFGFKPKGTLDSNFKFDAYIIYDHEDQRFVLEELVEELQNKRGHKLCVDDINFIPGTIRFNNTICAIQNSTMTLLVVSPASTVSPDVEYDVQMATMEEIYSKPKRPVLHLLMYESVGSDDMPAILLTPLRQGRFREYPEVDGDEAPEDIQQKFWDDLSGLISHTTCDDTQMFLRPDP